MAAKDEPRMPFLRPRTTALIALLRQLWPLGPLGFIALMTAAPLLGPHSTKLDFLGQFLLQLTVATTATLFLFIVARRRLAAGAALLALLTQLAVLQPSFISARASNEASATVDVLFANVWWHNQELEALVEAILDLDADILVLVEVHKQTRTILADLATAYPHRADCLQHWTCDGAILSRLPIVDDVSDWRAEQRMAMSAARVQTSFGPIAVAGVHLDQPLPPGRLRHQERQAAALVEMLAPIREPMLLVGDFNSAPWGRLLRGLRQASSLKIAWGLEGTWPAFLPWPMRIPIDHAFTGRGLELVDRQVIRLPGSDHMALKLRIGPSATAPAA